MAAEIGCVSAQFQCSDASLSISHVGVFDSSKLDLSSLQTNAAAEFLNISTAPPTDDHHHRLSEPHETAKPKLGLAPLNSEKTLTTSNSSGDSSSPLTTGGSVVTSSRQADMERE